ncbi:hypothetical protein [Nocardia niwae]|uniref:Uncharacterized protein n=1 Tax=Nocardia niwae TaxID=626084 RepID=A0ABV2XJQ6_9NOCA
MVAATTAAKWGRELARGKVLFFEAALLGTTVALNTGPHLAAGDLGRAAEYAIAPVMVGVVIWLHAWVSARYAVLIDGAPVIERDRRMIRLDAQPSMPEADEYHSLDAASTSGRSRWEGDIDAARVIVGDGSAPRYRGTSEAPGTHRAAQPEPTNSSAATMPATSHVDHGRLPTNGHAVESLINGYSIDVGRAPLTPVDDKDGVAAAPSTASGRTDARATNGRAVDTVIDGCAVDPGAAFHPTSNGRFANGHTLPPIEGNIEQPPLNGNTHPRINGHTVRPATNGHTVADAAQPLRIDGNIVHRSSNGRITESRANGDAHTDSSDAQAANDHAAEMPADIEAHTLPLDRNTARATEDHTVDTSGNPDQPVGSREVAAPPPHAVPPVTQHVPAARVDGHPTRPAESEEGGSSRAEAPEPESRQPRLESAHSATQQISLADLHDGLEFGEHSRPRANGAASTHAAVTRGERSVDRARRGDDAARRPGPTEPMPTPSPASVDTAAQVHPNATAPRAAKRGKSATAEQNDHSADAESEQLALEETPELSHPRVEPMPVIAGDDEDDEFPAELEEADTDDDEISAIAREITSRRLSSLPIEEVREILTLADQGGSTPAIANELGVPRSAVTRVLDSAIKVHRPYAIIG